MTLGRIALALPALGLALGLASTAHAAQFDIDLSDTSARIDYRFDLTDTGLKGDVGLLHHQDDGDLAHFGIILIGDAAESAEPFTAGLGVRGFAIDANAAGDGVGIAIGGFVRYVFPDFNRFAIGGDAYIAPSVTSFGDVDRYFEYSLRGEYRITKAAGIYVGAREVKGDFGAGDATIDDGLFLGISLEF
jgi:hypothetical protein